MKYIIKFNNKKIGQANTKDECRSIVWKYINRISYESLYQRYYIVDGIIKVDYGSHTDFFYISHSNGTAIENLEWFEQ